MSPPSHVLRLRSLRFVWEKLNVPDIQPLAESSSPSPDHESESDHGSEPGVFHGWGTGHDTPVAVTVFSMICLITLSLVTTQVIHNRWKQSVSLLPEAAVTIIIGVFAGGMIHIIEAFFSTPFLDDTFDIFKFNPVLFLILQLPPIIFSSGYHVNTSLFYLNFAPIILFSLVGTIISAAAIAIILYYVVEYNLGIDSSISLISVPELAAFAALISATDPVSTLAVFQQKRVDLQLFYLVFGESVFNDAVGIVLFDSFSAVARVNGTLSYGYLLIDISLIFLLSAFLGVVFCVIFAQIFRRIDFSHNPLSEMTILIMLMYSPFALAESLSLSGIVTILFTAMFAKGYVIPSLSARTAADADAAFKMFAHLSETSIFLVLGASVVRLFVAKAVIDFHIGFLGWSCLACVVGRALNIYLLSGLYNCKAQNSAVGGFFRRRVWGRLFGGGGNTVVDSNSTSDRNSASADGGLSRVVHDESQFETISLKTQNMCVFAGLRGAVAFACALNFPNTNGMQDDILLLTMLIVLITVFLLGSSTSAALEYLQIEVDVDDTQLELHINEETLGRRLMVLSDKVLSKMCLREEHWQVVRHVPSFPSLSALSEVGHSGSQPPPRKKKKRKTSIVQFYFPWATRFGHGRLPEGSPTLTSRNSPYSPERVITIEEPAVTEFELGKIHMAASGECPPKGSACLRETQISTLDTAL
jgi:NhaP-type Na+/H+ or K+/H+ antiporter